MILFCLATYINSIITGVIASILFFVFGYLIQTFRYWWFLKRKFHNVIFNTYWKRFPNEIAQTLTCTVKRNRIIFTGTKTGSVDVFEGQFIMNPINLKTGEGFHTHKDSDGFAFPKIIIKDNDTFFVDAPYTGVKLNEKGNKVGFIVYQAFIWKRAGKVSK